MKYGRHPYQVGNMSAKKQITLDIVRKIVTNSSLKCLNALLVSGWDVNSRFVCCTKNSGTMSVTALHLAVEKNWCDGVAALVECGATLDVATVPVEIGINGGICVSRKWFQPMYTPLMMAAEQGCLRCLETIINANCDVSFRENVTQTSALRLATFRGHVDCVMSLLKAKHDTNAIGEPLCFPVTSSRTSFYSYCPCSVLITAIRHFNGTIHINCMTSPASTDRHQRNAWLNVIQSLLDNDCDVTFSGRHQETTPLIESVESADTRVLELLLRHGAQTKVNSHVKLQMSPRVSTALDLACFSHNFPAAQLLIEHGASVEGISDDLLEHILEKKFLDIATLLVIAGYKIPASLLEMLKSSDEDLKTESFMLLFTKPWSLQALCRKTLRLQGNLTERIKLKQIGLPLSLQSYVLCKFI